MKKERVKKQYPEDFKTIFGLSTMGWTTTAAQSFMTILFMLYLTDYSGINSAISGAVLGTTLLFIGRIVDAFDDPLQGWIMDNTKPTKWGKYKLYCMRSTVIITLAITMLYSLPHIIINNSILSVIWVMFFYLLYDIGTSFYAEGPLRQTMTKDEAVRAKTIMWPRLICMLVTIPFAYFISIVKGIDVHIHNLHQSFSLATIIIIVPIGIISLIGASLVKEGSHKVGKLRNPKVSFRDILIMFKTNKPLLIVQSASLFGGFIWSMIFATTTYYIKWAYCVDITTGIVDGKKFILYTIILGTLETFPLILATVISPWLIKKLGSTISVLKLSYSIMAITGALIFIFKMLGMLDNNVVLFFALLAVILFGNGMTFVPGTMIGLECMDYAVWKTGKVTNGIINAVSNFINKAQVALSSAIVGIILVAIGYKVDPVKDEFIGNLSSIPPMLNSFIVITALIPAVLAIISFGIYHFYPIDEKIRSKMKLDLEERRQEAEQYIAN